MSCFLPRGSSAEGLSVFLVFSKHQRWDVWFIRLFFRAPRLPLIFFPLIFFGFLLRTVWFTYFWIFSGLAMKAAEGTHFPSEVTHGAPPVPISGTSVFTEPWRLIPAGPSLALQGSAESGHGTAQHSVLWALAFLYLFQHVPPYPKVRKTWNIPPSVIFQKFVCLFVCFLLSPSDPQLACIYFCFQGQGHLLFLSYGSLWSWGGEDTPTGANGVSSTVLSMFCEEVTLQFSFLIRCWVRSW